MAEPRHQATRLDAIEGRFDPWLLGATLALACLGVVMVGSSSIAIAEGLGVGPFHFLGRHVVLLLAGAGLAAWVSRTELKWIEQHDRLLLLGCFVMLLLVFMPGIGHTVNGAQRWIRVPGISTFQMVEAVKVMYIVWLASYLKRYSEEVSATWPAMLKPIGVAIVLVVMGGIFVIETLSVMAQVASFKLTGKRIFRMAPIHHHFELKGWPEPRVIVRFWIISVILVLVGLATLKVR